MGVLESRFASLLSESQTSTCLSPPRADAKNPSPDDGVAWPTTHIPNEAESSTGCLLPVCDTKTQKEISMHHLSTRRAAGFVALFLAAGVAFASLPSARAFGRGGQPQMPSEACDNVRVPEGNRVAFHVYATGVQIYEWTGTSWRFVAPVARLFKDPGYRGEVGIHYVGPTWESYSGSRVVARAVANCVPDPGSIAWLRLEAVTTAGPGIFGPVTQIQRVNTEGGLAPSGPGSAPGETVEVLYTAEYYFYRAED
jgi:hypothetical protein